ncbi:MAG: hypothetical protein LBL93_01915 [Ruminococcus sp.]|nr:hypothetical protein [Ruminococcus sp.]
MKKIIPYFIIIVILNWLAYITCCGIIERKNDDAEIFEKKQRVRYEKEIIERYNEENGTNYDAERFKHVLIKYYDDSGEVSLMQSFEQDLEGTKYTCDFYKDINGNLKMDTGKIDLTNLTYAFTAYVDSDGDLTFENNQDKIYYENYYEEGE